MIYNSKGEKVGNFDIFDENDGKVVNAGGDILKNVKPKIVIDKSKNVNDDVFKASFVS